MISAAGFLKTGCNLLDEEVMALIGWSESSSPSPLQNLLQQEHWMAMISVEFRTALDRTQCFYLDPLASHLPFENKFICLCHFHIVLVPRAAE